MPAWWGVRLASGGLEEFEAQPRDGLEVLLEHRVGGRQLVERVLGEVVEGRVCSGPHPETGFVSATAET